jgi:hypothetical protein
MVIGIHWRGAKRRSPELEKMVRAFFDENYGPGKTNEWWAWYAELRVPWNDWTSVEATRGLYCPVLTEPEKAFLALSELFVRFSASLKDEA